MNRIGSVEPRSTNRHCNSGPLMPGIRTSIMMQPSPLRQIVQQVLAASVSCDVITRLRQAALKRSSERGVVINYVDRAVQHGVFCARGVPLGHQQLSNWRWENKTSPCTQLSA